MAVNWGLAEQAYNPLEALQAYGKSQTQAVRTSALQSASAGDLGGARSMAAQAGDFDLYSKLGSLQDSERKQLAEQTKAMSNLAFGLKNIPESERQKAFSAVAPRLIAQGFDANAVAQVKLDDSSLDGYVALSADIGKAIEPYTLAPGAKRIGANGRVIAENSAAETPLVRSLRAAGIDPQSPQGQAIITQNLNPPQYMQFGSDATGRQLIQTRGDAGQVASAPGGSGQPLSVRLNNPGAIRYDPANEWQGQVANSDGFVQFDTPENGLRAQQKLLGNYLAGGFDTPAKITQRYAPSSDGNNPVAYAQSIARELGIGVNDPIPPAAVPRLAAAMARVEAGGTPAPARASGPRVVASTAPVASAAPGGKAPSGYRFAADGNLEAIPGGPGDKAFKGQGKAVPDGLATRIQGEVDTALALRSALGSFKDDFGGNALGSIENIVQGFTGSVGTPGQRDWWSAFAATDNQIRNKLFGASLTEGEKAAYNATTINPRMAPSEIRRNLQRRLDIAEKAIARRGQFMRKNGYNGEAVASLIDDQIGGQRSTPAAARTAPNHPSDISALLEKYR